MSRYFATSISPERLIEIGSTNNVELWMTGFEWYAHKGNANINLKPTRCKINDFSIFSRETYKEDVDRRAYGYEPLIDTSNQILAIPLHLCSVNFQYFLNLNGTRSAKTLVWKDPFILAETEQDAHNIYVSLLENSKQGIWKLFQEKMGKVQTAIDKSSAKIVR